MAPDDNASTLPNDEATAWWTETVRRCEEAVKHPERMLDADAFFLGVRDGQLKRELRQEDIQRLRQMWDEGVAGGSAGKLDMKKLRKQARERLQGAKKASDNA
jgi:antitoxin ParD1/3/4